MDNTTETPILWIDLETTDSDVKRGGAIHQMAYMIDIDGKTVLEKEIKMAPFKNDLINAASLEFLKIDLATIRAYPDPVDGFKTFIKDIHSFRNGNPLVLGGFNIQSFDLSMLSSWYFKCRNKVKDFKHDPTYYWYNDCIDVRCISIDKLRNERHNMPGFQLGTVATYLGITPTGGLHDALTDIRLTRDIYYHLKK